MITWFRALSGQQHKISLRSLASFSNISICSKGGRSIWPDLMVYVSVEPDGFNQYSFLSSHRDGNMRSQTSNAAVRVLCTEDETYVLGPLTTPYMFVGGRKLRVPSDLRPYSNDAEYIVALAASEREDTTIARCSST